MTQRFELLRLRLVGDDDIDTRILEREFPTVSVERASTCGPSDIVVDDYVWRGAFDLRTLDEKIEHAGPVVSISVRGYDAARIACAHCDQTLGRPGEDLRPALREVEGPLAAAGAVRGEDYDERRFSLRKLCCPHCASLIVVQVALDGVSPPARPAAQQTVSCRAESLDEPSRRV